MKVSSSNLWCFRTNLLCGIHTEGRNVSASQLKTILANEPTPPQYEDQSEALHKGLDWLLQAGLITKSTSNYRDFYSCTFKGSTIVDLEVRLDTYARSILGV